MSRRAVIAAIVTVALAGAGLGAFAIVAAQQDTEPPKRVGPVIGGSDEHIGTPSTPSSETASTGCEHWSAESAIAEQYGEIRNCGLYGSTWVITTLGKIEDNGVRSGGVIALYACADDDRVCLDNGSDHALAGWTFVTPPFAGEVRIMDQLDDGTLILGIGNNREGHKLTFDVRTRAFGTVARTSDGS